MRLIVPLILTLTLCCGTVLAQTHVPTKAELQRDLGKIQKQIEQLTEQSIMIRGVLQYMELEAQAGREASQEMSVEKPDAP